MISLHATSQHRKLFYSNLIPVCFYEDIFFNTFVKATKIGAEDLKKRKKWK